MESVKNHQLNKQNPTIVQFSAEAIRKLEVVFSHWSIFVFSKLTPTHQTLVPQVVPKWNNINWVSIWIEWLDEATNNKKQLFTLLPFSTQNVIRTLGVAPYYIAPYYGSGF